jgi:surface antigen
VNKLVAVILCAGLLAACESDGYGNNNEVAGTIIGAGLGMALGSTVHGSGKAPAMMAGALLGGALGNRVGNRLDEADRIKHQQAYYQAMEYNRDYDTAGWYDPDTGVRGAVTPRSSYTDPRGLQCREYQQEIWIGGRREEGYGTACRMPDGSWKIMNDS